MAKAIAPRSPDHQSMNWWGWGMRVSGVRRKLTAAAQGHTLAAREAASATKHTACKGAEYLHILFTSPSLASS